MQQTHSPGAPRAKSASPFRQDEYQGCLGLYVPLFRESDFNRNKQELGLVVGVGKVEDRQQPPFFVFTGAMCPSGKDSNFLNEDKNAGCSGDALAALWWVKVTPCIMFRRRELCSKR